jgi:anaerobic selenocysteine-containing dehydrogenase
MNRNLTSLRKVHPDPVILIHQETAKNLTVEEKDWVWIANRQGRAKFKVKLSSDVDPRVVVTEHAWWFPEKDAADLYGWQESNINLLTSNEPPYEPSLGTVNLRGIGCRIYKA